MFPLGGAAAHFLRHFAAADMTKMVKTAFVINIRSFAYRVTRHLFLARAVALNPSRSMDMYSLESMSIDFVAQARTMHRPTDCGPYRGNGAR